MEDGGLRVAGERFLWFCPAVSDSVWPLAMEEAPEDTGGSPSLFQLCARAVTANMERLEEEVWGLPAVILQDLLPLLNIYYLERIEAAAARKGLSTQSVWCKLWSDVMKNKPTRLMSVTCWRKKFLETFFHSVLRGTLDVSSDWRLYDRRFSPLVHSSGHVTELTVFGKQQGVLGVTPDVTERLAQSVESLKFLHLRLSDPDTQQCLRQLLHRLIHHGRVAKVSVLSWPRPDRDLLLLILRVSAGFWQEVGDPSCPLCPPHPASHSALLSLQPLTINQNVVPEEPQTGTPEQPQTGTPEQPQTGTPEQPHPGAPEQPQTGAPEEPQTGTPEQPQTGTPEQPHPGAPEQPHPGTPPGSSTPDPEEESSSTSGPVAEPAEASDSGDLYDFIFQCSAAGEEPEDTPIAEPLPPGAIRLRSVTTLNLHNVFLTPGTCRCLCQLLRTWTTLERLTLAYNDLQSNIGVLLEALSDLSRMSGCSLTAVSLCDFSTYVTILDLAQTLLRLRPHLHSLLLCYDLEESSDKVQVEAVPPEFPGTELRGLDLRFPHSPLDVRRLVSALKASPRLRELSLDNAVLPRHPDVRLLLRTITEYNEELRRFSLHDVNLMESQDEVVSLLSRSNLEEVKLSFCRLFERGSRDFLAMFVGALKRNSSLKTLKLGGNRLGNRGFCALADLYAADSLSSIQCLDVSSNCVTSAGFLQFALRVEGFGGVALRRLVVTQNNLETDPVATRSAIAKLRGICCVMKDSWDSAHAFADHVSVM